MEYLGKIVKIPGLRLPPVLVESDSLRVTPYMSIFFNMLSILYPYHYPCTLQILLAAGSAGGRVGNQRLPEYFLKSSADDFKGARSRTMGRCHSQWVSVVPCFSDQWAQESPGGRVKMRLVIQKVWAGPEVQHFLQVPRGCCVITL